MKKHSKTLKELRDKRDKLISQRNWQGALVVLEQMLDIEPTASRYTRKAMVLSKLKKYQQSYEDLQQALQIEPDFNKAKELLKQISEKLAVEKKQEKKLRQKWQAIVDLKTLDLGDAGATYKGKLTEQKIATDITLLTPAEPELANDKTVLYNDPGVDALDSMKTLGGNTDSPQQTENMTLAESELAGEKTVLYNNPSEDTLDSIKTLGGDTDSPQQTKNVLVSKPKNTLVDRYEIVNEIARGGMGAVFSGNQVSLQRKVAIKKMLAGAKDEGKRQRFIAESKVTALLNHPNIVPVYELEENPDGEIILAMKLVNGNEWKDLIYPKSKEHKKIAKTYDEQGHLGILLNVCNAVGFAHSKGVVHNDLKLANIMVGEFGEVLVMDWGIAIDVQDGQSGSETHVLHKSMILSPMGTPSYMPAELAEGRGNDIGPWTDVYLLGGILYEILMKKPPHSGTPIVAMISSVSGKLPEFDDTVAQELQEICHQALTKDIKKRYQSVNEFKKAIEDYLKHRESIKIVEESEKTLIHCNRIMRESKSVKLGKEDEDELYGQFTQAISGFGQALKLWQGNTKAITGKQQAHFDYAMLALQNEDLGLAEAQVKNLDISHPEKHKLTEQIHCEKQKKIQAEKTAKRLRKGLKVTVATTVIILSVGIWLLNLARNQALKAAQEIKQKNQEVEQKNQEVKEQKKIAEQQRNKALINLGEIALAGSYDNYHISLLSNLTYMQKHRVLKLCGAFAGQALGYIKNLDGADDLKHYAKNMVRLALLQRKEIWKSASYGHLLGVNSIAFSPDGKKIVSGSNDNTVRVWDANTGKEILKIIGHTARVKKVAFNDNKIISGSSDNTLRVWDANTGKEISKISFEGAGFLALALSPDGKKIAASTSYDEVKIWEMNSGKEILKISGHKDWILALSFSPDSNKIAASAHSKIMRIWDANTGKEILKIFGHVKNTGTVVFSPDGKKVVSGCHDKNIRIWDASTGKEISKITGHSGLVFALSFSADGKKIVSCSRNKTIRVWDTYSGKQISKITGHISRVNDVIFSPDDNKIVSASKDSTIRIWDANTGKEISKTPGHISFVNTVAFSHAPGGPHKIASGSNDRTIRIWDGDTGKQLLKITGHTSAINKVTFSSDGKTLASCSDDNTVRIWNTNTGKQLLKITGHTSAVNGVAFSPNHKALASCSADNTVRIWNANTGKQLLKIADHISVVNEVTFSSDGKTLASCSDDNTVRIWNTNTGKQLLKITHPSEVNGIAFNHTPGEGKTLASCSNDNTVRIWNTNTGKEILKITGHTSTVNRVAFSPDNKTLASCSADNTVRIWDTYTGKEIFKITRHEDKVNEIAFSPDGSKITSGSNDKTVMLWDVETSKEVLKTANHPSFVNGVAFSPDGKTIASCSGFGGEFGIVIIWDVKTGKQLLKITGHESDVNRVIFSSDGKTLASCSDDNTVRIWDAKTGKQLLKIAGHTSFVNGIAFSRSPGEIDKKIASCSDDKTVRIWDVNTGKQLLKIIGHTKIVKGVAFSPDGKTLVSCSDDNTVRVWDTNVGKEILKITGHTSAVNAIAFSPDGGKIASGASDNTIRIWNANNGKQILKIAKTSIVYEVVFSSDSKKLISCSNDKTIRIWDVKTGLQTFKIIGHTDSVLGLALSNDGKKIVSGSDDKTARIWYTPIGKPISKITDPFKTIALSPDNKQIALIANKTVKIWNLETGRKITTKPSWLTKAKQIKIKPDLIDVRTNIPGWLIEVALDQHPKQITRALFGLTMSSNLLVDKFSPVYLWDSLETPTKEN